MNSYPNQLACYQLTGVNVRCCHRDTLTIKVWKSWPAWIRPTIRGGCNLQLHELIRCFVYVSFIDATAQHRLFVAPPCAWIAVLLKYICRCQSARDRDIELVRAALNTARTHIRARIRLCSTERNVVGTELLCSSKLQKHRWNRADCTVQRNWCGDFTVCTVS